jgi:3-dehydroquinate dehydratase type I
MILILRKTVKATCRPRSVGVIFSAADLDRTLRIRQPPDLWEVRLDGLIGSLDKVDAVICQLQRPVIITARAPKEGGENKLSVSRRRSLLQRFLPIATMLDIELSSSSALNSLLKNARAGKVQIILSRHQFTAMPPLNSLQKLANQAHSLGADVFKIVARTDDQKELCNLITFARSKALPLPVSAMGIGKLGPLSRKLLARNGSVLNYAHLGHATIEGQLSLAQLHAIMAQR